MNQKEWIKQFEEINKRKPSPQEFATALKMGLFEKDETIKGEKELVKQVQPTEKVVPFSIEQAGNNHTLEVDGNSTTISQFESVSKEAVDIEAVQRQAQKATSRKWMIGLISGLALLLLAGGGLFAMNQWNRANTEESISQKSAAYSSSSKSQEDNSSSSKSASSSSDEASKSSSETAASSKEETAGPTYKPINLDELAAGDHSSVLGDWVSASGNRITVTEDSFHPDMQWGVRDGMFMTGVPPATSFMPANQGLEVKDEFGNVADFSRDRLVALSVRGSVLDQVYYRETGGASASQNVDSKVVEEITKRVDQYRTDINASLSSRSDQIGRNFTKGSKDHQEVANWVINESASDGIARYDSTTHSIQNVSENGDTVSCDITYSTVTTMTDGSKRTGGQTRHYVFKRVDGKLLIDNFGGL